MNFRKEISKIILPLTYKKVFTASWNNYENILKTQWDSKDETKAKQWIKLKKLINHAYENVDFYKTLFNKHGINPNDIKNIEDFKKLPIISKKDFSEFSRTQSTARNVPTSRIKYMSTSGSTGTPFEYGSDKAELGIRHLLQYRSYNWAGWDIGDKYVYFDGMIGGDGFNPLAYKLYLKYTNFTTRRMHVFSDKVNSDEGMRTLLAKVNKYNPKIIRTTVSQIRLIMKFVEENKFEFTKAPIITVGETLTEEDRISIKKILGSEIFESYGAGEFCGAYECDKHNGLHVSEENVYLEVIKENKDTKPGEQGKIVITNLNNYAWPFIRYDMGDLGILAENECSCGRQSTLLKEVSGRVSEFVITKDNKLLGLHDFTQIIGHNVEFIKQWQIVQEVKGNIKIVIVPTEKMNDEAKKQIMKDVSISSDYQLESEIILVDEIPASGQRGKRHLIKSSIKKDF